MQGRCAGGAEVRLKAEDSLILQIVRKIPVSLSTNDTTSPGGFSPFDAAPFSRPEYPSFSAAWTSPSPTAEARKGPGALVWEKVTLPAGQDYALCRQHANAIRPGKRKRAIVAGLQAPIRLEQLVGRLVAEQPYYCARPARPDRASAGPSAAAPPAPRAPGRAVSPAYTRQRTPGTLLVKSPQPPCQITRCRVAATRGRSNRSSGLPGPPWTASESWWVQVGTMSAFIH